MVIYFRRNVSYLSILRKYVSYIFHAVLKTVFLSHEGHTARIAPI